MLNVVNPWMHKPVARFNPKRTDTLRPELMPLIGVVAEWRHAGTGGEGEPYPGQQRWIAQDERFDGLWAPSEDLEEVDR